SCSRRLRRRAAWRSTLVSWALLPDSSFGYSQPLLLYQNCDQYGWTFGASDAATLSPATFRVLPFGSGASVCCAIINSSSVGTTTTTPARAGTTRTDRRPSDRKKRLYPPASAAE